MIHLRTSRRSFIKGIGAITATGMFPNLLLAQGASKKVGIGIIGVMGKGQSDASAAAENNEIVAICDVDSRNLAKAAEKYPNAKRFSDFRKMLEEVKSIEAVTVSTPDHAHYPAAMEALHHGKHIFVQKPLNNTLWECRQMYLGARKKKVITQMGNQGHTYEDNRVVKEWIAAGAIGKVKEVHVWTNRPIWPQGKSAIITPATPPETLDWLHWQAATPDAPYSASIVPFKWRGFLEYGAGAFGDMGCHLIDAPNMALGLGVPSFVTAAKVDDLTEIAWPTGAIVKMEFPGNSHGDVTLTWYEGKKPDGTPYLPEFPAIVDMMEAFKDEKHPEKSGHVSPGGWFIVGTEGIIFNKNDQAKDPQIWPKKRREEFLAKPTVKTEPRSVTPGNPQQEWTEAIKRGSEFPWMSNFDYASPLTELTLIGGLAMHFPGQRLAWDSRDLKITNHAEANNYIKRKAYRKGYEYSADSI
ncbi:MAG: Gfo/Idh/MocA family oxidoreductase [Chthoniobacteraceae bacterium]